MRKNTSVIFLTFVIALGSFASAQNTEARVKSVYARPEIQSALKRFDQRRPEILELWRKLALTSAPSGHEDERAAIVMQELRALGYNDVYRDTAGNVVSAPLRDNTKSVVFVAHLDTVVQPGVKVTVAEGKNEKGHTTWTGPGVGDDTSGVLTLLEVAEALHASQYHPSTPLVFVFSVNEEGGSTSEGAGAFSKRTRHVWLRLSVWMEVRSTRWARSPITA